MDSLVIRVTEEFYPLQEFFHRNGLEIDLSVREPVNVLRLWEALDAEGRRLGAAKLERRAGELVLAGIAVEPEARHRKIGSALLSTVLTHCRTLGAAHLRLVARAPGFFKRAGFTPLDWERYRQITKCYACPQRGRDCFPELLSRALEDSGTQAGP